MVRSADKPASLVLLDELFEQGDDRFVDELFACTIDKKLASLAKRWYEDARPWARRALFSYVDDGCDRPRHRVLVKALLNLAEARQDDELMAHFLRAFDRLIRRELVTVPRYDWSTGKRIMHRRLVRVHPNRLSGPAMLWVYKGDPRFARPTFSMSTRRYLRRRAFRWLRMLRDPERFFRAATTALVLYTDADVEKPEHLLETYGLTSLLYYGATDVLARNEHRLVLSQGRTLAELEPAPLHEEAWRGRTDALLRVIFRSDCLLVRRSIVRWLEREEREALAALHASKLKPLLLSQHADLQVFAVRLLERAQGVATFPVTEWLELLALDNPEVVLVVAKLVEAHVAPDRLSLAQCVELACSRHAKVAELGLSWLKEREIRSAEALREVMRVADASVERVRSEAAKWLLEQVKGPLGTAEHLRDVIDARHAEVRAEALIAMREDARFADSTALWIALSESPYPDVIEALVRHLGAREAAIGAHRVEHVWAKTLLAVHRGGRAKRTALRQIADRVARDPDRADALLPILRVALRSVREPERRSALAAVCRAAFETPALRDKIAVHMPELELFAGEVTA